MHPYEFLFLFLFYKLFDDIFKHIDYLDILGSYELTGTGWIPLKSCQEIYHIWMEFDFKIQKLNMYLNVYFEVHV